MAELKGDLLSIDFFLQILLAYLNTTVSKDGNSLNPEEFKVQTTVYKVRIMGNPNHLPEPVTIRVTRDYKTHTGTIKADHGIEFLEWHTSVKSLCHCCAKNLSHTNILVCAEWLGPTSNKQTCEGYKFSERKLDEYLAGKKSISSR